jgi:hypothetical protein
VRCTTAGIWHARGYRFSAATFPLTMADGYRLVALPLDPVPAGKYWAEGAGAEIGSDGGQANVIVRYGGGAFWTHPVGTSVENFQMLTGAGYFIRCGKASTWTVRR